MTPPLPNDLVQRIPPLHTQDSLPDAHLIAYSRLTFKAIGYTWFLQELQSDQDTFSAYLVDPQQEQFGYFSFGYLEEHLGIASLEVLGELPGEGLPINATLALHRAYYYAFSFTHDAATVYQAVRDIVLNEPVNLSAICRHSSGRTCLHQRVDLGFECSSLLINRGRFV